MLEDESFADQDLVDRFFKFYYKFDYKNHVISPYLGTVEMRSDFKYMNDKQWSVPICIGGPIKQDENHGVRIKSRDLKRFVYFCGKWYRADFYQDSDDESDEESIVEDQNANYYSSSSDDY